MNRCYQVIWSKVRQEYVVVSELAKRCGKSSSQKSKQAAAMLTAICLLSIGGGTSIVCAADDDQVHYVSINSTTTGTNSNRNNNGATGDDAIAIGVTDIASGYGAIAIGRGNTSDKSSSLTLGIENQSHGVKTEVIGYQSSAVANNSTVIGNNSMITDTISRKVHSGSAATYAMDNIVVGQNLSVDGKNNAVFGTSYNNAGTTKTYVAGDNNAVIGVGNLVGYEQNDPKADPQLVKSTDQNVVVGLNNTITGRGIAVGKASKILGYQASSFGDVNTIWGSDAGGGDWGVALGNYLTVKGTEAVAIGGKNTTAEGQYSIAVGSETKTSGNNTIAIGRKASAAKGEDIALGYNTTASGGWSLAMGGSSVASAQSATAIGGYKAQATITNSVALGSYSVANTAKGVAGYDPSTKTASTNTSSTWKATLAALSIGDMTAGYTRQITNVAAGYNDTDAVNVAQLKQAMASITPAPNPGGTTTDTRNTVQAGDHVNVAEAKNTDGSSTYTVSVKADGEIANGNTGIVTGDTVYQETRVKQDGNYIKAENTAGENITALDRQTKQNTDDINNINNQVTNIGTSINKLGARINRVGAGAAALAALHPQDFDPDDKWDFAAGYGNYKDTHAVAIGAFYRPTEDVLFSVGGSFAGGENLVNAGVTFKLGQHTHITRSRVAMAKDMLAMKEKLELLTQKVAAYEVGAPIAKGTIASGDRQFPDVPENHWAYEYVTKLANAGYLKGYPDGEFKGDRSMTRYEYAAIIYRALQNGAVVDGTMIKTIHEFKPELTEAQEADRFRVDRISGKDNDRHKIERVRINDKDEGDVLRDVYGSKIKKA